MLHQQDLLGGVDRNKLCVHQQHFGFCALFFVGLSWTLFCISKHVFAKFKTYSKKLSSVDIVNTCKKKCWRLYSNFIVYIVEQKMQLHFSILRVGGLSLCESICACHPCVLANSLVLSFGLALSNEKFHVYWRMLLIAMLNYAMKDEMIDHFVVVRDAVIYCFMQFSSKLVFSFLVTRFCQKWPIFWYIPYCSLECGTVLT